MSPDTHSDNNSSHAMDLDSEQLKELEKLIDDLKKEIVFPKKKAGDKPALSEAGQR